MNKELKEIIKQVVIVLFICSFSVFTSIMVINEFINRVISPQMFEFQCENHGGKYYNLGYDIVCDINKQRLDMEQFYTKYPMELT